MGGGFPQRCRVRREMTGRPVRARAAAPGLPTLAQRRSRIAIRATRVRRLPELRGVALSNASVFRRFSRPADPRPAHGRGAPDHEPGAGFALPAVLLLLAGITVLATGGFLVANGDFRISQYHTAGSRAFHTADAALQDHLGTNRRGHNTVSYSYASGKATVVGDTLLDIGDGNMLYTITSSATHQPGGGGSAARSVRVVAMLSDAWFRASAAITAGSGLHKNGNSGAIDGHDQATWSDCSAGPQSDIAGVATGPGLYTQNGAQPVPDGNPPVDDSQSGLRHLEDLGLDWAGITSGSVIEPDFTLPGDSWPDFSTIDPDWWPVIYLETNYALDAGHTGRGTIIAEHDLTMNGSFEWDGIILVGGVMTSDGKQTIEGTTITALNMLLGQTVGGSSVGNGNKSFEFHSCWVRYAAQQFVGGLVPMPGTWSEGM